LRPRRPLYLSVDRRSSGRGSNGLAAVSLDDKYTLESGRVFITGTQALVRLPMMQRQRDHAAGLDTACFVTGYRGSPLGGVDQAMWRAKKFLRNNQIHFQPGVNEDLAATAVWGSQQTHLAGDNKHDGVFALWWPQPRRFGYPSRLPTCAFSSLYGLARRQSVWS